MSSLKDAASLINELSQETQLELYKSWQHNQDGAVAKLVEIAKEKGQAGYDSVTVKRLIEEFIAEVQKNDENEDLELREGELSAVSGGSATKMGCEGGSTREEDSSSQQNMAWKNAEEEQEKQRVQRQKDIDDGSIFVTKNII